MKDQVTSRARERKNATVRDANVNMYATRPTRFTLFMRTFLPWQLWRFFRINLNMMQLIRREKNFHK